MTIHGGILRLVPRSRYLQEKENSLNISPHAVLINFKHLKQSPTPFRIRRWKDT
jgi:hypothetical protein